MREEKASKGGAEQMNWLKNNWYWVVLMVCSAALGSTVCRDVGNLLKGGLR